MNKAELTEGNFPQSQESFEKNTTVKKVTGKRRSFKSLSVLMAIIISITVLAAGCSFFSAKEKEFTKAGMTINLTDKFVESDIVSYAAAYTSADVVVYAIKEEFAVIGGQDFSLEEYAEAVILANGLSVDVTETDGLTTFTFSKSSNGKDFQFFSAVYKGSDAYWFFQFGCDKTKYNDLKDTLIKYAKSVKV